MGNFERQDFEIKELVRRRNKTKYFMKKSKASCSMDDVHGFIYGGMSARFWMMRKHINLLSKEDLINLPLYSWECITILTKYRTIDLLIKNQSDMFDLLYFLISKLKTIDGNAGSAKELVRSRV